MWLIAMTSQHQTRVRGGSWCLLHCCNRPSKQVLSTCSIPASAQQYHNMQLVE